MIKLDKSPSNTVVVVCDECKFWSAIRFGMLAAHECAAAHEARVHPDSNRARWAADQFKHRAATRR